MEKLDLKKFKKQLEKEKKRLTKELTSFAKRDKNLKGNWRAKFPVFGNDRSHKDENAEEVEAYSSLLSVEYNLENRLKDINKALEKIEKGKYGICEICNASIELERLRVAPEASLCVKCGKKATGDK